MIHRRSWPFHAEIDCILANSLLRSFPEVIRIGLESQGFLGGYQHAWPPGLMIASPLRFPSTLRIFGRGFALGSTLQKSRRKVGDVAQSVGSIGILPAHQRCPCFGWMAPTTRLSLDSLQKSYRPSPIAAERLSRAWE